MTAERTWQYELTRDRVGDLQHKLEWALQRQNRRFADALDRLANDNPIADRFHRAVPVIFRVLGGLGLALVAVLVVVNPHGARRDAGFLVAAAALFVAVIAIAPFYARIRARIRGLRNRRQLAGRMLARQAAAIYRKVAAKAPYTIDYRLTADALEARAPALGIVRRLELRLACRVHDGGDVLFVFRRSASLNPYRYIYLASPDDHDAVVAALVAAGATVETMTGPVPAYVPPVPEARVHSG